MDRVTTEGISEMGKRDHVDFLCELDLHENGLDIFNSMFPKSGDVFKENTRDVFKETMAYVTLMKHNSYSLTFKYAHARDANKVGRLYAQVREVRLPVSQQMCRTSVRKFLQCGIYKDFDIKASYWAMLVRVCERLDLGCHEIKKYLNMAQSPQRDEYLESNGTSKAEMKVLEWSRDADWYKPIYDDFIKKKFN